MSALTTWSFTGNILTQPGRCSLPSPRPPQAAQEPAVQHAMQVREAVCTHDWSAFFRLYACAPNMGRALLDMAAPSMRWTALNALVKTFKPSVALPFVARVLGFAPRLADAARPASAGDNTPQPPADESPGAESPVQELEGLPSGAGLTREANGAAPSGAVSDACVAGTGSVAGDAALEVLPGCSQAVYKGKYQAAVRVLGLVCSHENPLFAVIAVGLDKEKTRANVKVPADATGGAASHFMRVAAVETRVPVMQDDPEESAETCIDWLKMHGAVVLHTPGGVLPPTSLHLPK